MTANNRINELSEIRISQIRPNIATERQDGVVVEPSSERIEDNPHISTVSRLTQQAMSTSDVRMDKVAAVQRALNEGTYKVSISDVAEKLIEHMKELH
jgi:negative regulator of flagellin synthesis FlgM